MYATAKNAGAPSRDPPRRFPFRLSRRPNERVRLLGQLMDMVKPEEVLHFVAQKVVRGEKAIVANHNAHSLYLVSRQPEMAAFYARADLVEVDSLPLLAWARLTGRGRTFHRCTYLDWRDDFWDIVSMARFRVFFLGGAPGVAEAATAKIHERWPSAQIAHHHGYFDSDPNSESAKEVVARIRAYEPDIVLVGMGMPRQELWIHQNFDALPACVILPVGGAFDYEAGVQVPAPRWLGKIGLEWLFRLAVNPRRLFRRYCVEPWLLAHLLVEDAICTTAERLRPRFQERRSPLPASAGSPRRRAVDRRGEDLTQAVLRSPASSIAVRLAGEPAALDGAIGLAADSPRRDVAQSSPS